MSRCNGASARQMAPRVISCLASLAMALRCPTRVGHAISTFPLGNDYCSDDCTLKDLAAHGESLRSRVYAQRGM